MNDAFVEASSDYALAAQFRAEMSREWEEDWDRLHGASWRERFAAYFATLARTGDAQLFVARVNGEPAGMAIVSIQQHYRVAVFGTRNAYVNGVFVRERFRRRGIGSELMRSVEEWARAKGCTMVRLRASEDGAFLYATLGYERGREMEKRLPDVGKVGFK